MAKKALLAGRIGLSTTHRILLVGIRRLWNFELLP
jgi:hypothetical protein